MADSLSELLDGSEFAQTELSAAAASPDDLFSLLETFEESANDGINVNSFNNRDNYASLNFEGIASFDNNLCGAQVSRLVPKDCLSLGTDRHGEFDKEEVERAQKKLKTSIEGIAVAVDEQNKLSHITVERNRRKQMNNHLSVLRSLMPCFYVKRGDQASIIGGVIEYIKELQQVLQSLESKKQRKVYSEVLSPRPVPSPRPTTTTCLSPRTSALSSRIGLSISPRTPQSGTPYKPSYLSPTLSPLSPSLDSNSSASSELAAANSKTLAAEVEVKFSGPNVLVKTASQPIPGQALKIIAALEGLALEILHVSISTVDDTLFNSFTIKIGIECELSAEELAQEIQQTFS